MTGSAYRYRFEVNNLVKYPVQELNLRYHREKVVSYHLTNGTEPPQLRGMVYVWIR